MSSNRPLPGIDTCVALYLNVWNRFGDRSFTPEDLARRLVRDEWSVDTIAGPDEPRRHLDLLVAYGLLESDGNEGYRVRCTPEESVEQWHRADRARVETLHQRVQQRRERFERDPTDGTERTDRLERMGEDFVSLHVDEGSTFENVAGTVEDLLEREADAGGVALRSPAVLTGHVQRLADDLCGPRSEADGGDLRLEKVTSDVVGEHKDDLEYRLYLRRV